jgi:starch synthase
MKVLLLAAELSPLAKVGGLGDVVGELPQALNTLGVQLRVYIPFHSSISRELINYRMVDELPIPQHAGDQIAKIYLTKIGNIDVYLIDGEPIASVDGIYSDPGPDGYKYTFFCMAAMASAKSAKWRPDILHAHDWHASPAVVWLYRNRDFDPFWNQTASLLTVHNLPYMGAGAGEGLASYGIDPVPDTRLPDWAQFMPLPMGLATTDWINAVSPTYAQEIQSPAFGHGLEDLIVDRQDHVVGIVNGIDLSRWDPGTDDVIPVNFNRDTLKERAIGRSLLLEQFGLDPSEKVPLIAMITRLVYQKGADLAIQAMSEILEEPWQFLLLGTGDPALEQMWEMFETSNPDRVRSVIKFEPELSRQIYASADVILIPSRYEPCGLTQMIAMRYGCVPVVAATGGLKDTVSDYRVDPRGTGFVFDMNEGVGIKTAVKDAISIFQDKRRWRGLQLRGMARDYSWDSSAREYLELYERAHQERIALA